MSRLIVALVICLLSLKDSWAQAAPAGRVPATSLDSLLSHATATSPLVRAAIARRDAARHRVGPATAWPDPTLTAGIENQPLGREPTSISAHGTPLSGGPDPMTMRVVGVSQAIPYPGKLRLQRAVADREVDEASASLEVIRRRVTRDVKAAYYELAFLDRALDVVNDNQAILGTLIRTTEARYSVGQSGQQDVLSARIDATRLAESASALLEQRRATLARLNALLDRPSDTPLDRAVIPRDIERAAIGDSTDDVRFASAALGARVSDSPLPSLTELQDDAIRESPELREHEAMIAAQTARVELSGKAYLPDLALSVQYGQRGGSLPDMLSATVSLPIPLHRKSKQDEVTADASATLTSLHAEHDARANALRAEIARIVSELERQRTQLALYRKAILPQAHAALASATSSYQVGKVEFVSVLQNQSTVFTYETDYYRALSEFATNIAELDRMVAKEIVR